MNPFKWQKLQHFTKILNKQQKGIQLKARSLHKSIRHQAQTKETALQSSLKLFAIYGNQFETIFHLMCSHVFRSYLISWNNKTPLILLFDWWLWHGAFLALHSPFGEWPTKAPICADWCHLLSTLQARQEVD